MVHSFMRAFGRGFTAELALRAVLGGCRKGRKGIETAQPVSTAAAAAAAADFMI